MINRNAYLKPILLAMLTIIVCPTNKASDIVKPAQGLIEFVGNHKTLVSVLMAYVVAGEIYLQTMDGKSFKLEDLPQDYEELLNYNLLDFKFYKQFGYMFGKYMFGRSRKINDKSERTREGDKIITMKKKHFELKEFGLYGYIQTFMLKPLKNIMEYVAPAVGTYVLVFHTADLIQKNAAK